MTGTVATTMQIATSAAIIAIGISIGVSIATSSATTRHATIVRMRSVTEMGTDTGTDIDMGSSARMRTDHARMRRTGTHTADQPWDASVATGTKGPANAGPFLLKPNARGLVDAPIYFPGAPFFAASICLLGAITLVARTLSRA